MIQVAIIAGGPSAERGVSLKSAKTIATHLPPDKYNARIIDITAGGWQDMDSGQMIDLNSFTMKSKEGDEVKFEFAFIIIHGTPAEDGKLQGYLEMMGIPHSACGVLSSALTFNKQMCKDHLKQYNIPMAESMVITRPADKSAIEAEGIRPPFFVKPNNNGSSYGVTKVRDWTGLAEALFNAFTYDHEVMIERALIGTEYSCGVVREGEKLHVFPVTEIIPEGEFFDFAAKYEGHSQEITPARLRKISRSNVRTDQLSYTRRWAVAAW